MTIMQRYRLDKLTKRLDAIAGEVKFIPQLRSDNPSLDRKPTMAALSRVLAERQQVVLEGVAGSGKTVLALHMALSTNVREWAYIEGGAWSPKKTDGVDEFVMEAGCDHEEAMKAYRRGKLVLIVDAIDEAPWSTGGRSAPEALVHLSGEIDGKAGLLVTTRTRRHLPELPANVSFASLAGIDPADVESFLAFYVGSRRGAVEIVDLLKEMEFPEDMRYSPLLLRRFADGLRMEKVPSNIVELFEGLADFHIGRECLKPGEEARAQLDPDSWQARYSDPERHRSLVSALVFGMEKSGREVLEDELEALINLILAPAYFDSRAKVELYTLMTEHPLVVVTYRGPETYDVECPHDWARIGLFPKFLSENSLAAQIGVLDTWHEAIPYHEDYAHGWAWLERTGRADENLKVLLELSASPEQAEAVGKWLAAQMFSPAVPKNVIDKLFSAVCQLAHRFASPESDLSERLNLTSLVPGPLLLSDQNLRLAEDSQVGSFGGLVLEQTSLTIADSGPSFIRWPNCSFHDVSLEVENDCKVQLIGCHLAAFRADLSPEATLVLEGCLYDPSTCSFPEQTIGLDTCEAVSLADQAEWAWALAEVLRRLIVMGERPELARKKANLNEHYVYGGLVSRYQDKAEVVVQKLIAKGYVDRKPTGSIHRLDPTGKFDAHEAARYMVNRRLQGAGPMTQDILSELVR